MVPSTDPKEPKWQDEFWIWWSWEYNLSLVADTFGVLLIVVLSKWLYEEDSDVARRKEIRSDLDASAAPGCPYVREVSS